MDILIHTLSGTATAALISTFTKAKTKIKLSLILLGGFAGALPDIDAISLWSGFDSTIGKWLHLKHTGMEIYFGKFWYSHHGFFHSLLAAALLAAVFICLRKLFFKEESWEKYISMPQTKWILLLFFCSYVSHLIGDLPTPAAAWGGVRLFFPFEVYIGGFGTTWWWNNYDVFLSLLTATILLIVLTLIEGNILQKDYVRMSVLIYVCCVSFCTYFVTHRSISYAYEGNTLRYTFYERTSKMDQYSRLRKPLFKIMTTFDNKLPVYF